MTSNDRDLIWSFERGIEPSERFAGFGLSGGARQRDIIDALRGSTIGGKKVTARPERG